jgi:hypothetical protein
MKHVIRKFRFPAIVHGVPVVLPIPSPAYHITCDCADNVPTVCVTMNADTSLCREMYPLKLLIMFAQLDKEFEISLHSNCIGTITYNNELWHVFGHREYR